MSRIILGSAQIGEVDQKTADELLSTAFDAGLAGVDTAPSYGDSEVRIGRWIRKTNQRIRIYSKVGTPEVYGLDEKLTPSKIQTSVDDSLARLGVETLDTLFLHSTASSEFNESNLEALLKLKKSGKILSIGYSGDGSNLAVASEISNFETLMMSINCLDQTNLVVAKKAQELGRTVIAKRVLGNAVWLDKNQSNLLQYRDFLTQFPMLDKFIRKSLGAQANMGFTSYNYRFKKMFGTHNFDIMSTFLNFPLSIHYIDKVLIGTTSKTNLLSAISFERDTLPMSGEEIQRMELLFARHKKPSWSSWT